jgi:hypothetical protein
LADLDELEQGRALEQDIQKDKVGNYQVGSVQPIANEKADPSIFL